MGSTGLEKDKEVPSHQKVLYADSGLNIEERAQVDWRQKQLQAFQLDTRRLKEVSMPRIYIHILIYHSSEFEKQRLLLCSKYS